MNDQLASSLASSVLSPSRDLHSPSDVAALVDSLSVNDVKEVIDSLPFNRMRSLIPPGEYVSQHTINTFIGFSE